MGTWRATTCQRWHTDLSIGTLESAFDLLDAGVLFVDADCRIIHANRAAQLMLQRGSPVQSACGELRTDELRTTAALRKAVADAAEREIGPQSIGVALPQSAGGPAHIHVLPLVNAATRGRPAPRACAALFVTVAGDGADLPAKTMATVFDLTPAETRTLERLLVGRTAIETAHDLGVSVPTVRTHLAAVFAKTGTSRQSELLLLAARLTAPVRRSGAGPVSRNRKRRAQAGVLQHCPL